MLDQLARQALLVQKGKPDLRVRPGLLAQPDRKAIPVLPDLREPKETLALVDQPASD